jgi:hypothetical protein
VVIHVSGASKGQFSGGVALVSIGGAGILTGLVLVLVGAAAGLASCDPTLTACGGPDAGFLTAGAVTRAAGIGLLIGGVVMLGSSRTTATQLVSELSPDRARLPETAWLRAPVWHDVTPGAFSQHRVTGIPLFTRTF